MKITAVNAFNNKSYINNSFKNSKVSTNTINEVPAKTLSEAIGRSQVVAFKGQNFVDGANITHECNELFKGIKETINYNKEDGSYIHTVVGHDGSIKAKEEYYPLLGKEIITRVTKNGTIQTVKLPNGKITTHTDLSGREILYKEEFSNGVKYTKKTEFSKNRQIIRKEQCDKVYVQVIDLRNGQSVTSGNMVLDERYDETSDTYYTENLITGSVYKKEKYRPNGRLQYMAEYFPETKIMSHEVRYNEKSGGYDETYFYQTGYRSAFNSYSKNNREQETYEFGQDGRTVTQHYHHTYNKANKLIYRTNYDVRTNKIISEEEFDGNNRIETIFKSTPNIPDYSEFYKDEIKYRYVKYQDDGEKFAQMIDYKGNGDVIKTDYTSRGKKYCTECYDASGFLFEKTEYYSDKGTPCTITKFNRVSGEKAQYFYNRDYGTLEKEVHKTRDGKFISVTTYYEGTQKPETQSLYNSDGSYQKTYFDIDGRRTKVENYNADGTKRSNYNSYDQRYRRTEGYESSRTTGRRRTTQTQQKTTAQTPQEQTLNHILSILASAHQSIRNISDMEWELLVNLTGVDDVSDLTNMTAQTYRKLAKKFHPDLNIGNPRVKECEIVFKIINSLNSRKQS